MSETGSETSTSRRAATVTPAQERGQPEPKWGERPPPERIAELEGRLAEWEQMSAEARGKGRSAFDTSEPQGWGEQLTGADVFYLAARALARSAEPSAIEAAAARLRTTVEAERFALDLSALHLEGAVLAFAHLEGAYLATARLDGADLFSAHLEGANLAFARLERANLTSASFDKTSRLNDAVLTGASFDQVTFDNTNLTVVDWSRVNILGDERTARARKDGEGKPKTRWRRLAGYKAAVRANRVLAVALQAQGLSEDAARFAYRAQLLQRRVLLRQVRLPQYLGSSMCSLAMAIALAAPSSGIL